MPPRTHSAARWLRLAIASTLLVPVASSTLKAQEHPAREPTSLPVLVARLPNTQPPPFAISPDETWVIEYGYYGNVNIRDLSTGETRTLVGKPSPTTLGYVLSAAVSPPGETIAYACFNADELVDVRIVRVDGSEPSVLYADPNVTYVSIKDWSPDSRELLGVILLITLVAPMRLTTPITDNYPINQRGEQIAQPLRLRAFFKCDMNRTAHTSKELDHGRFLSRKMGACQNPTTLCPHRSQRGCLVHV
jgi:hypothetical protein